MTVNYTNQQTLGRLKRDIRALAKLPRKQRWFDLSKKLDELHGLKGSEFRDLIHEGALNRRTAYYLRDVGQLLRNAKLSTSKAERIGWAKL